VEVCHATASLGIEAGAEAPALTPQRTQAGFAGDPASTNPQTGERVEERKSPALATDTSVEKCPAEDVANLRPDGAARRSSLLAGWIAADPRSKDLLERLRKLASSASAVLIRGESGTGKDLLALILHYLGPDAEGPLLRIDCVSLPPVFVEQELFGRMAMAGRGTIVLDEIAALSMPMQAKLLHIIEDKRLEPLGGSLGITVEARIIALTGVDLEHAVARHSFREDLYYRLSVAALVVPPLRERPFDVRPLAWHLLERLAEIHRKPQLSWSEAALAGLEGYRFPGNVRELKSIVEQAVICASAPEILLQDLPAHVRPLCAGQKGHRKSLEELEREYIAEILDYTHGKKTKAANILGISRKTLLEKRKRYGLA